MPDKIYLMLENILNEFRVTKQEISNIKKDMITHEEFTNHTECMSSLLNDISIQQNKQTENISSLESRFNKQFENIFIEKYKKVGGTFLFLFIIIASMFFTSFIPQTYLSLH